MPRLFELYAAATIRIVVWLIASTAACIQGANAMTITASLGNNDKPSGPPSFSLRQLDLRDTDRIDGIKLTASGAAVTLVYSVQEAMPPAGTKMVIRAAAVDDLENSKVVATVDQLLPAKARWDVRESTSRGYDLVFERAGGALNALMFKDSTGAEILLSVSHPFESFFRPHFVIGTHGALPQVAATADKKKTVLFPPNAHSQPTHYEVVAECADALVGQGKRGWVVTKALVSGRSLFDVLPGKLSIIWRANSPGGEKPQNVPFPDLVAFEFDAANANDDVIVFATAKPAVLLRASAPAKPIHLSAAERSELSQLASPTVIVVSQYVHLAAIANPGTKGAKVLYGKFPVSQVLGK